MFTLASHSLASRPQTIISSASWMGRLRERDGPPPEEGLTFSRGRLVGGSSIVALTCGRQRHRRRCFCKVIRPRISSRNNCFQRVHRDNWESSSVLHALPDGSSADVGSKFESEPLMWFSPDGERKIGSGDTQVLPFISSTDVYLPGTAVNLSIAASQECCLYEDMLLGGGRLVVTSLQDRAQQRTALYGTLLFLEDLRDVQAASGGEVTYVAEHRAIGRVKLIDMISGRGDGRRAYQRVEVEVVLDADTGTDVSDNRDAVMVELQELARLQGNSGGAMPGDVSAAELISTLLPVTLDPCLQAVQGLWRANAGVRIRIHGADAVGVGKLEVDGKDLVLQLTSGRSAGEFRGRSDSDDQSGNTAEVLQWSDGDVWVRLARPPPYTFDCFGENGAFWDAVFRWSRRGSWRTEVRRGEARLRSAEGIREGLTRQNDVGAPDFEAAEAEWLSAARGADADAEEMLWEEVLEPCQRILQAPTHAACLRAFRGAIAVEARGSQRRRGRKGG
ncbi:unnamed protein product [Prorocentrum cordatum]|uniref:Uncharacterized protein n=1 Tax=Prorocentrum cordatum TaxID=2364126 RepID=A0ABN9VZB0_9DINO|nr:unnamed protein product [Polarella glacialis]